MIGKNVQTDFSSKVCDPVIDPTAYVHPMGAVIGNVIIGKNVFVAPFAAVRGDEGQPLHVGDDSNVQDGVVIHALETEEHGKPVEKNLMEVGGKKYAVYVGNRVSLAHQVQIHGPAVVLDDSFVGMKVLVFRVQGRQGLRRGTRLHPHGCLRPRRPLRARRYRPAGPGRGGQAARRSPTTTP